MNFPSWVVYLLSFDFAVRLTLTGVSPLFVSTCPIFEPSKGKRRAIISCGLLTAFGLLLGIWSAP